MRKLLQNTWTDLLHTVYPRLCFGCNTLPAVRDGMMCVSCLAAMPFTDHFKLAENKVTMHFWGRVPLKFGAALLNFRSKSIVQNMIHGLKYEHKKEIGLNLGLLAGERLLTSTTFVKPDILIPVPLHPSKEISRGYNQSYIFGRGVSDVIKVPVSKDAVIKFSKTDSQTGKSRTDRVLNVSQTFRINQPEMLKNKHVMILDDVVTTGATIEAVSIKLIESGVKDISLLVIAAAEG
ncbi:MAG: ComF family protein [Saprospiraceae bacterium]|nr:ComF family protein [Saprospiraceae bacterium]